MNFQVKTNVYKTPDGVVTHDPNGGENELVLVAGAVVSSEVAERLNLAALDEAARSSKVESHLDDLKPFEAPAEAAEVAADASAKPSKPAKKAEDASSEVK